MRPSKLLPAEYHYTRSIDLTRDRSLLIGLNVIGVILLFIFGFLFTTAAIYLRGAVVGEDSFPMRVSSPAVTLLSGLLSLALVVILHELIHGLFFWLFTGEPPRFGFKGPYAYAAAPKWYLPRNQFLVVGLAPIVLLTLAGLVLLPNVHASLVPLLLLSMTFNAAGAAGDLYTVGLLFFYPSHVLVQDQGDSFTIYTIESPQRDPAGSL